jgi:hypothetical protein
LLDRITSQETALVTPVGIPGIEDRARSLLPADREKFPAITVSGSSSDDNLQKLQEMIEHDDEPDSDPQVDDAVLAEEDLEEDNA